MADDVGTELVTSRTKELKLLQPRGMCTAGAQGGPSTPSLSTCTPIISALGMANTAEQLHFQHCLFRLILPCVASAPWHEPAEESSTPGDAACLLNSPAASPLLLPVCYLFLLFPCAVVWPKGALGRISLGFAALLPSEMGSGR